MEEIIEGEPKKDPKRVIHQKLEDIMHSQQSVVEKIGQVEVDLMNHPDKELEKELGDMMTHISNNYDKLKEITEKFGAKLDPE